MKIWIVWLPNVWKSTLFNALTKSYAAESWNFPFCTIDANIWVVDVKDKRVDELAIMSWSENRKIYANIQFVDIAWLVRWASKWEWLWNKFLWNIKEVDCIVQVVRHFEDDDINHVDWWVDPLRDIETINTELILADLDQITSKLPQLEKKMKTKDAEALKHFEVLKLVQPILAEGNLAWNLADNLNEDQKIILKQYNLLTFKPFVYCFNVSEDNLKNFATIKDEFTSKLWKPVCVVSAKIEAEMIEFSEEDRQMFLDDLSDGWKYVIPTLDDLIKTAFDEVWLMYYFTTWEKETRAWTIKKNSTAPQAAWAIHTDFQRGFIKAEVVSSKDLLGAWSWNRAKESWLVKLQWKEYIVQDWDVIVFKFNV